MTIATQSDQPAFLRHNLSVNKNLTLVIDHRSYRQIVKNPSNTRYAGVYYNIEQVKVKNFGAFHPKFYLFVSNDEMLLLTGSFNLTNSGFKRNFESVIRFKFRLNNLDPGDREFIIEVKDFLQKAFVDDNDLTEPVTNSLKRTVGDLISSPFFQNIGNAPESTKDTPRKHFFISSLDNSLIHQLKDRIGDHFNRVQILSPFYDSTIDTFKEIQTISDKVEVYIPSTKSTFPKEAFSVEEDLAKMFTFSKVEREESNVNRFVHAKYYSFLADKQRWIFITSANFSSAGLFRGPDTDNKEPRNFEIGVLIRNNSESEGLPLSELDIEELLDFDGITCDADTNEQCIDSNFFNEGEDENLLIESAYYDNEKIHLRLFDHVVKTDLSKNTFKANLLLDQSEGGEYPLQVSGEELYFIPGLEIEGDTRIQFSLVSKATDFVSTPANVNRLRHEPNYLPALGASAFHECVRLGGEEGLEKAYTIAQNSGKEDWLLHLLTHWPLEKILEGLKKGNLKENNPAEPENLVPSLKEKTVPDYRHMVLRKNISTLLGSVGTYQNLKKFLEMFDNLTDKDPQKIIKYNKFCFPLFLEITFSFYKILCREEKGTGSGLTK